MTALSTLVAACFAPTRNAVPRRSVTLNVESLEQRQVLSGSPLALARPDLGPTRSAGVAPERIQADEAPAEGWYVEFRRAGGRWNVRGPLATPEEAMLVRKRLRRQGAQVRMPFQVPPQEQPPMLEIPVIVVTAPVSLQELKSRTAGLEWAIPPNHKTPAWANRRDRWYSDVNTASTPREVANLILNLTDNTYVSAMQDRDAWLERSPSWVREMQSATTPEEVEALRLEFRDNLVF